MSAAEGIMLIIVITEVGRSPCSCGWKMGTSYTAVTSPTSVVYRLVLGTVNKMG